MAHLGFKLITKSIVVILVACIGIQCTAQWMVYALYKINKDYISKNLCEQRNSPNNHCMGKCHMRKQMQKTDCEQNPCERAPIKKANTESLTYLLPQQNIDAALLATMEEAIRVPIVKQLTEQMMAYSIFQPPRNLPA